MTTFSSSFPSSLPPSARPHHLLSSSVAPSLIIFILLSFSSLFHLLFPVPSTCCIRVVMSQPCDQSDPRPADTHKFRHFKLRPLAPCPTSTRDAAAHWTQTSHKKNHQCGSTRVVENLLLERERVMEGGEREQMGWQRLSPSPKRAHTYTCTHSHTTAASQAES